ncbi:hypothetical protein QBC35DRAFT_435217 [Podospora australis]|uniref:Structural maintenance of chromosomes protein 5 n=1 Tax=Podospora australis TaxID=1536484 RepID=A0AAN7AG20_9PEZI|nr:hypothetical protein QBC35DRAFT_435217 [Podospora australis]
MPRRREGQPSRRTMQDDDEESSSQEDDHTSRHRTGPSGAAHGSAGSEFPPGAIVRVKLRNFVTYSEAEFFLGPNLNMVIGPNGTGKSSLVCAICLGLGYSSNVLGRASAFGEFVKYGSDEAEIEVELQRKPEDAENYIVGLCIRKEDNGRKFTINRQRSTHKEVQKLMRSLRIQIDNLCQFLPQDKVAEFAGLGAVELLEKTLLAAAPEEMIEWHAQLKENFRARKDAEVSTEKTREEVQKMEARQQVLQADVDKLRERKAIQQELERLEELRVILGYKEARAQYVKAKKDHSNARRSLKRLQDEVAPSLQAVNRKQEYRDLVKAAAEARRRQLRAAESAADEALNGVEAAHARATATEADIEAEIARFTCGKKKRGTVLKAITDLKAKHQQKPREFKAGDWNTKSREIKHHLREKQDEAEKVKAEIDTIKKRGAELKEEVTRIRSQVDKLDTLEGQLASQLQRINADAAQGWDWVRDHQDQFEKQVFGPPLLNCSLNNKGYSDLVQSLLGQADFICFTVQTKNDHKKLSHQLYREMSLSAHIRTSETPLDAFKPLVPKEQLGALGFDGYALDYLEGPAPVLAMLCNEKKLHASPVALGELTDEQDARAQSQGITNYAAGKTRAQITRRREYEGAVSTKVVKVQKGRFWSDEPVDGGEREELVRKSHERAAEFAAIKESKEQLQHAWTQWCGIPDEIERQQVNLQKCTEALRATKERKLELVKIHEQAQIEFAKAVLQHASSIGRIRKTRLALLEAEVILLEAESDVDVLKEKSAEVTRRLDEEKKALAEFQKKETEARKAAMEAKEELEEKVLNGDEAEVAQKMELAQGQTLENIRASIQAEEMKLDLVHASNPQALEEYERYAAKIAKEKSAQQSKENRLAEINANIQEIRARWEPQLDALVSRINDAFSYNFEQISCAGEVGVHKDEEFEKWAISIKVKFRSNETLQRLDQHRQSGGERAVSTIFYLMALQSMAQAPFRVVDEINQGMDPRNERMVHERMVEVACREHTSQYFLITPKLLPGLRYDERMRVHTIVSGEHVDKTGTQKMNFARFLKIQKELKGY